jgi:hypothetical protein
VVKGFNSDIEFQGQRFHVQSEDWGDKNPYLVSTVYWNGAVIKSVKIAYLEVLPQAKIDDQGSIHYALKCQHQKILDLLVNGQLIGSTLK